MTVEVTGARALGRGRSGEAAAGPSRSPPTQPASSGRQLYCAAMAGDTNIRSGKTAGKIVSASQSN